MADTDHSRPRAVLSVFDALVIMIGLVIGIGIFRTPSIVAGSVSSEWMFIAVWVAGGLITLIGALCYAELAAAHPNAGGEYHFLSRAYGRPVAMLFGWARCTVIQSGAIAAVAFVFGDYMSLFLPLGQYGPALYAALAVLALTAVNIMGTVPGKNLQTLVTFAMLGALAAIILFGLSGPSAPPAAATSAAPQTAALGMAMIFVLLTYGGWNEAAYLAGELKDPQRNAVKVLVLGSMILAVVYTLTNFALLAVLGLEGLRGSSAVAADMMRAVTGPAGETLVSLAILAAAISTLNATIFTGARVFYSMARDMTVLQWVGIWRERGSTPANAYLLQAGISLALIAMGAMTRDGFKSMVDYTAPVFWGFLFLTGLALFVLRRRAPDRKLPYRVPLYPLTPLLFCLTCLYMLYSSVVYTGVAGSIGLLVLAAGLPILLFQRKGDAPDSPAGAEAATARINQASIGERR